MGGWGDGGWARRLVPAAITESRPLIRVHRVPMRLSGALTVSLPPSTHGPCNVRQFDHWSLPSGIR